VILGPRPRSLPPQRAGAAGRRTVDVIVPSYDYAYLLPGCVDSVLDQRGVDVRILIVDDCSSDDTAAVGEALAASDARVEFRRHDANQGLIATANEGLAWAEADHVVLLSADDFLAPGALRRAVSVMDAHPEVGMVYGRAPYFHADGGFPSTAGTWRGTHFWCGADWIRVRCRSGHNCISSPEVVVRRSVARTVGPYDPLCTHASDLNMWLRIAAVSDVAYVRGVPQAVYRIHPGSMLRSAHTPLRDLEERWKAFASFFESCGPALGDAAELRTLATRALARQALWRASRAIDRNLVTGPEALPVEALVEFALKVYEDAPRLREWRGLQLRRSMGAGRSRYFIPFVATGAAHRVRGHATAFLGARTGV
jgi:glycosyltransferase involved in cell wall biosynthesis